ncbi:MAG: hypothetical protein QM831_10680 [Kofleriaceae bacterium]
MLNRLIALAVLATTASSAHALDYRSPPDRAAVKAALAKRRAANSKAFDTYVQKGVYPHNTFRDGPLNVWLDDDGHFCAAATMIVMDGHKELAIQTSKDSNNIRLLDVTKGELLNWMLTSGFTIEEIDQIQAPAVMPEVRNYDKEDAALKKHYVATEKFLKAHASADLDTATTRLMKNPDLAWQLVNGGIVDVTEKGEG